MVNPPFPEIIQQNYEKTQALGNPPMKMLKKSVAKLKNGIY